MTPEQFTQLLEAIRNVNDTIRIDGIGISIVLLTILLATLSRK